MKALNMSGCFESGCSLAISEWQIYLDEQQAERYYVELSQVR